MEDRTMSPEVHRREPSDDPPWIEVQHEGASYEFQIVGEDELQLTATGEGGDVAADPPAVVVGELESRGYEVRT